MFHVTERLGWLAGCTFASPDRSASRFKRPETTLMHAHEHLYKEIYSFLRDRLI